MAKNMEKEILDKVLDKPKDSDLIARMVESQEESFPSVSDITLGEAYVDPFTVPKWCDQKKFAFAWIDPKDDIQRHRAMDVGHFRIVNRLSSCISGKVTERDFRDHGAIERQGVILVFRPKDLDEKLRTRPVFAHKEMVESLEAGKEGEGYELTHLRYKDGDRTPAAKADRDAKVTVVAQEEAGELGIKEV